MRQAAAVSIVSTPMPASMSGRSKAGAGKRRRAPLPKMTSSGLSAAMRAKCSEASDSNDAACHGYLAAPRHDDARCTDAADGDAFGPWRAIAFWPSIRSAHFRADYRRRRRLVRELRAGRKTRPCGQHRVAFGPSNRGAFPRATFTNRAVANVCYDIRGPVLEKARQMEEEASTSSSSTSATSPLRARAAGQIVRT